MFRYVVGYLSFSDNELLLSVVHAKSPEDAVIAYLQVKETVWRDGFKRRHPEAEEPVVTNYSELFEDMDMAAIDNECFNMDFTVNTLCLGEVQDV
jgi:hypothetical protein